MAPFLGRIIAQVIVPLVAVLARAIPAAYSQAINNARRNGVDASSAATQILTKKLSKSEALSILNIAEKEATAEAVERVSFVKLFLCCERSAPQRLILQSLSHASPFFRSHSNLKNTLLPMPSKRVDPFTYKAKFIEPRKCWMSI
jgi:hypothetical protein